MQSSAAILELHSIRRLGTKILVDPNPPLFFYSGPRQAISTESNQKYTSLSRLPHDVLALVFEANLDLWSGIASESDIPRFHSTGAACWGVIIIQPFQSSEQMAIYLERFRGYPLRVYINLEVASFRNTDPTLSMYVDGANSAFGQACMMSSRSSYIVFVMYRLHSLIILIDI